MEVRLVVASGKSTGQRVLVTGQRFFIGRAEDCNLRPNTDLISRHHCVVTVEDGMVTIRDLGSRNGTFLNEERIRGEEELNDGDKISVGPLNFEVEFTEEAVEQSKNEVPSTQETVVQSSQSSSDVVDEDELDLSDWLGSDADAARDTRSTDQTTAATIIFGHDQDTTPTTSTSAVNADDDESTQDKKVRKEETKKPGRLPRDFNKPKTADSQAAAADTLRHFFHRR